MVIHPYLAFVRLYLEYRKFQGYISKETFHTKSDKKLERREAMGYLSLKILKNLNEQGSKQPDLTVKLMFL